jgi:hypothetical protein
MKFQPEKFETWLGQQEYFLPSLSKMFDSATSPVMVLGACVLTLYADQEWIPALHRKTGDLDLSVSLPHGEKDYLVLKEFLKSEGYRSDKTHAYRYHTPKPVPGALAYIDLLAQPTPPKTTREQAVTAMGAGGEFDFAGFQFALETGFKARGGIVVPNPFGFLALKQNAYRAEPLLRIKDLGDIIELCIGMVSKGSHYDLRDLWKKIRAAREAEQVLKMIRELASETGTTWDIDDARQELLKRGYAAGQIDGEFKFLLSEWIGGIDERP